VADLDRLTPGERAQKIIDRLDEVADLVKDVRRKQAEADKESDGQQGS